LLNIPKKDLALIYASIAQTYQDLEDPLNSLYYYKLELENCDSNDNDSVESDATFEKNAIFSYSKLFQDVQIFIEHSGYKRKFERKLR
jgi:hypothetical protein